MAGAPYKVEMRVTVTDINGRDRRPPLAKEIASVDPMKVAQTRAWASRNFNRLLKECGRDEIVSASFWAQQVDEPHSSLHGGLGGVNGCELRRTGMFERF